MRPVVENWLEWLAVWLLCAGPILALLVAVEWHEWRRAQRDRRRRRARPGYLVPPYDQDWSP